MSPDTGSSRRLCATTLRELWKTESRCSSQAERFSPHAVDGKLSRSGEWPITPKDKEDVHDGFSRSIWNWPGGKGGSGFKRLPGQNSSASRTK